MSMKGRTMKSILPIALALGLGLSQAGRPTDPFIQRGTLREKARMIFIGLNANLTVVYDGQGGDLYLAYLGLIQDGNLRYNQSQGNKGSTLTPQGKIVFKMAPGGEVPETAPSENRPNTFSPPNEAIVPVWFAGQGALAPPAKVSFKGYAVDNAAEKATLRYSLETSSGGTVSVTEYPEYVAQGAAGLQRDFTFAGVPAGGEVALLLTGNPIRKGDGTLVQETWTASGTGTVEARNGKNYLVVKSDGKTTVTGVWR
jgi:hypothetical protein